jgi:hypothetical protein
MSETSDNPAEVDAWWAGLAPEVRRVWMTYITGWTMRDVMVEAWKRREAQPPRNPAADNQV